MKIRITLNNKTKHVFDVPTKMTGLDVTTMLKGKLEDRFSAYLELPGGAVIKKSDIAVVAVS